MVSAAEDDLEKFTVEAEAAADASRAAKAAFADAEAKAAAAAAQLESARAAVDQAQDDAAALGREAFMGGASPTDSAAALLDAAGPAEMLERAATLDLLGEDRAERLAMLQSMRGTEERADREARAAVAERDAAVRASVEAEAAAEVQLQASKQAYDAVAAQKLSLDQQLRDAEIELLAARGVANPSAVRDQEQRAEIAQARAGTAALVAGRVTSCYGSRSGAMHNGVDIAAPIGTPIYAPAAGVVLDAGPASGFGLAVYVQHADGTITVYGHINQYFVQAGQAVAAGQQIAEVGNRGQSTGPHLHIETHQGGLYQNRANPVPWLGARGITLGGSCG
ncbi:Murein DD-endopeptidase MepM and murein hydrolase activator NlpD, contain LysM domain [Blastococcus aurantiacus]|uniref:Murein DD-endopeptidase MepM and murein hydrolase activator NlpD, contain LysM domain n=2 Tax=Blastococcus aurantiacus TaxID=1550231 RepID=A0A1G7RBD0_9ACTN|nr:Murein DD-endopeptidase MepM and murein hydrolase activator NlpD, contain LysM domain [Blastococcus aurantiacus]